MSTPKGGSCGPSGGGGIRHESPVEFRLDQREGQLLHFGQFAFDAQGALKIYSFLGLCALDETKHIVDSFYAEINHLGCKKGRTNQDIRDTECFIDAHFVFSSIRLRDLGRRRADLTATSSLGNGPSLEPSKYGTTP
jgi:hypothetical protein